MNNCSTAPRRSGHGYFLIIPNPPVAHPGPSHFWDKLSQSLAAHLHTHGSCLAQNREAEAKRPLQLKANCFLVAPRSRSRFDNDCIAALRQFGNWNGSREWHLHRHVARLR
jgi:hypothetical protein